MGYDYNALVTEFNELMSKYKFIEKRIIGRSVMNKPILCAKIGTGDKNVFINCAHHGLEYLTSAFIMNFLRNYAKAYDENKDICGRDAKSLYEKVTLYIVPMVNPDGVDIAVNGLDITNPFHRKLISDVGVHSFNKVWQANIKGVDINHNYNAGWRVVTTTPGATKYSGPYAESEPETRAVVNFVKSISFDMLIAFHSQGGEIYYDYDGLMAENSLQIAEKMADESGYKLSVPTGTASFGGCKDWFIKEFGKAGFTVEIGHGENPLPLDMLWEIYDENAALIVASVEELCK
jgi:g-D-glutamyl-meso-diaminopimelate peptidase